MRRRELLVISPDFPPEIGGIQTLAFRVTAAMTRFRPRVVTLRSPRANEFDSRQSFPIVRVNGGANRQAGVAKLNSRALLEGIRRPPVAILSLHISTGPAALAVGYITRRPVIQYVHAKEIIRRRRLALSVLQRADAIVAVSRYSRSLVRSIGCPDDRARVILPGVDSSDAPPDPPLVSSSIAIVGRLTDTYKGHDVLLESLRLVRRIVPEARLEIIGDGPLRPQLERLAEQAGVAQAVTFHGAVSDHRRDTILNDVRVVAMPSRIEAGGSGEGFGIVYIEAGALGLPVVGGNVGGALDAVVDGETGLLVDPRSPAAVAEALASLLVDHAKAARMGRAGWERARLLSWERTAAELEALIGELV